jgi:hypothetical protein
MEQRGLREERRGSSSPGGRPIGARLPVLRRLDCRPSRKNDRIHSSQENRKSKPKMSTRSEVALALRRADNGSTFWVIPTLGSVVFGFLVGRWWAMVGPVILVVVIGLSGSDSDIPWEVVAVLWGVISFIGVSVGIFLRRFVNRLAERP